MSHQKLFDNKDYGNVADKINELAEGADRIDIAVGYFYINGFELIGEAISNVDSIRILVGKSGPKISNNLRDHLKQDIDGTKNNESGIYNFYDLLQHSKTKVRFYPEEEFFHPKLYLFEKNKDIISILGSSNLSKNGFKDNIELNRLEKDEDVNDSLESWFSRRWNESQKVSNGKLIEAIEKSELGKRFQQTPDIGEDLKLISPFEATKRLVRFHYEDELKSGDFFDIDDKSVNQKLTDFQKDAVIGSQKVIDSYGGVIVADSVGVGKSYIGAGILQSNETHNSKYLIIAPNRLEDKWMNLTSKSGDVPLKNKPDFKSTSYISRMSREQAIKELSGYDYILIDEAHKFRNKSSDRYRNIQQIPQSSTEFILLTATPIHNSVEDLESITNIFTDTSQFSISSNDEDTLGEILDKYKKYKSGNLVLEDPEKEHLYKKIKEFVTEIVIARDRKYIKENYPDIEINGKRISFPKRDPDLVTINDSDLQEVYDRLVSMINGTDEDEGLYLQYLSMDPNKSVIQEQNFLVLFSLLQGLSSSPKAFEDSLERYLEYQKQFHTLISEKKVRNNILDKVDGSESDILEKINNLDQKELSESQKKCEHDIEILEKLLNKSKNLYVQDRKIERLENLVKSKVESQKCLVFTQRLSTAEYLFEKLVTKTDQPNAGVIKHNTKEYRVGLAHGENRSNSIVDRFAPEAQDYEIEEGESEIDVLISTDVLSEGRDIQDASTVINYDLPYNPMKMEQRIGRIDRLQSNHDKIEIYNFAPFGSLKDELKTLKRLRQKINTIKDSIGHSNPILDKEEELKRAIKIYEKVESGESDFNESNLSGLSATTPLEIARGFCESNNISTQDLLGIDQNETVYFERKDPSGNIILSLEIEYETGSTSKETFVFNTNPETQKELLDPDAPPRLINSGSVISNNLNTITNTVFSGSNFTPSELKLDIQKRNSLIEIYTSVKNIEHIKGYNSTEGTFGNTEQSQLLNNIENYLQNEVVGHKTKVDQILSTIESYRPLDFTETKLRSTYNKYQDDPEEMVIEIFNLIVKERDRTMYSKKSVQSISTKVIGYI